MQHDQDGKDIQQLMSLIQDIRTAMLVTAARGQGLRSRPMHTHPVPFDGSLWFMTSIESAVVGEIDASPEVLLTYAHPGAHSYVAVNGWAEVRNDRAMIDALWRPPLKAWFPEGPADPKIRVIRVAVERAEFWDTPSAPVRLFRFAEALVKGERAEVGEHTTMRLASDRSGGR